MIHPRFTTLLLAGILFSCAKERSCNCTISTSGVTTTRTQTAGFPPLIAGSDTTTINGFGNYNTSTTRFEKMSRKRMRSLCPPRSEETIKDDKLNVAPGVYTVSTSEEGTRVTECKVE
jgi:hypothetical protein